jgi:hypothetical protein
MTSHSSPFQERRHSPACSCAAIVRWLKQRCGTVRSGRFVLKPNHMWFICE